MSGPEMPENSPGNCPSNIGQEMATPTETTTPAPRNGRFRPGNTGGPGRPAGSRNAATLLLDQMADGAAGDVLEKMIEAARNGDMRAAELILSRVWPVRKGRPVSLDLPAIKSAADVVTALSTVAESVANGALTPDEAQAVAAVLEIKRKAIETVELEARVNALESMRQ